MGNAPKAVADLVERFRNRRVFQSPEYADEQLRAEFPVSA